jgi:hypothetical protein
VQLKFVLGGADDLEAVLALLAGLPEVAASRVPLVFQPVGYPGEGRDGYSARMRALVEDVLLADTRLRAYDWRFLPQFHKLLWADQRGI